MELVARLSLLMDSFRAHFDSEERMMRASAYPGLERHAEEHNSVMAQMAELRDDLDQGAVNLCNALVTLVRLWTERHIFGPDTEFAGYLHENNARPGASPLPLE